MKRLAEIFALPLTLDEQALLIVDANDKMPETSLEILGALVRAINCHDDLVAALKTLVSAFTNPGDGGEFERGEVPALDQARDLLHAIFSAESR